MKQFYVITNPWKDVDLKVTKYIKEYLCAHGAACYVHVREHQNETFPSYTDSCEIPDEVECIIVLGGDGTLLQAARDTIARNIPLLGVNLGTLGYLAEIEKSNLEPALRGLLEGELEIESRMMLAGSVLRDHAPIATADALNDIVIARTGSLQTIRFRITVNGQFLNEYMADGIIISTPTGSTGYNMSAGGPIVEPKAKLMVLTPICPHTLNTRSIVLADNDTIIIEMLEGRNGRPQEAEVSFDGSFKIALNTGDLIEITQSEEVTQIVKLNKVSFLEVLHKKMSE